MKFVFAMFVLVLIAVLLAYNYGGIGSFDPVKQGEQLKAEVTPGTSWEKVIETRPPKKYQVFVMGDQGFPIAGAEVKFDKATFEKDMKSSAYPLGYQFIYIYGAESQFYVVFEGDGKVSDVIKIPSVGDLLKPH